MLFRSILDDDEDNVVVDETNKEDPSTKEATPPSNQEETTPPYTTQEVNYKKRYDDLKKHYDSKVNEFKSREQHMKAEIDSNKPTYTPPKNLNELEEFKKKFPDVYGVVETVAHLTSEQKSEALSQKLATIEQREKKVAMQEAARTLQEIHPDWNEIKKDPQFHDWAKGQPEEVKGWVYNNPDNASLASKAINLYKVEAGITSSTQQNSNQRDTRGSAADIVAVKGKVEAKDNKGKVWSRAEIANLTYQEYEQYEKDIDQALREGRVAA